MKGLKTWYNRKMREGVDPGFFENVDPVSALVEPPLFEGARYQHSIPLTSSFAVTQFMNLGERSFYTFGATYALPNTLVVTRFDTKPTVLVQQNIPSVGVQVKATTEVNRKNAKSSEGRIDVSWKGPSFSSQCQLLSSKIIGVSHLHSLTARLAGGFRMFRSLSNSQTALQFAGRYKTRGGNSLSFVTSSYGHYGLSYLHNMTEKFHVGIDCTLSIEDEPVRGDGGDTEVVQQSGQECREEEDPEKEAPILKNPFSMNSVWVKKVQKFIPPVKFAKSTWNAFSSSIGYQYRGEVGSVRGYITKAGIVGMLMEEKLTDATTFLVSGELNHPQGQSRFGIGLQVN